MRVWLHEGTCTHIALLFCHILLITAAARLIRNVRTAAVVFIAVADGVAIGVVHPHYRQFKSKLVNACLMCAFDFKSEITLSVCRIFRILHIVLQYKEIIMPSTAS